MQRQRQHKKKGKGKGPCDGQGHERRDKAMQCKARQAKARHDTARHGTAWHGTARKRKALQAKGRNVFSVAPKPTDSSLRADCCFCFHCSVSQLAPDFEWGGNGASSFDSKGLRGPSVTPGGSRDALGGRPSGSLGHSWWLSGRSGWRLGLSKALLVALGALLVPLRVRKVLL